MILGLRAAVAALGEPDDRCDSDIPETLEAPQVLEFGHATRGVAAAATDTIAIWTGIIYSIA